MRLIDADALIDDVDGDLTDSIAEGKAIEKIMNAPSIDAVPVVRCKDCKWRETWVCILFTPDNWFCPKGERKEQ